jgi:hypothetical protein
VGRRRKLGMPPDACEKDQEQGIPQEQDTPHKPRARPDFYPDWSNWREMPTLRLYEGVALLCNIEPEALIPNGTFDAPDLDTFWQRFEVAKRTFADPEFRGGVATGKFVKWALSMWKDLPREFSELAPVSRNDAEPSQGEQGTLFKIIVALADKADIDLSVPYKAAIVIEPLTRQAGLPVSERSLGKYLGRIKTLVEKRPPRPLKR